VSSRAGAALAAAIELEEVVDAITAIAASTEAGGDTASQAGIVRQRLIGIERVSMNTNDLPSPRRHR
jgi:hypothetical protein